ncbi:MAG: response regulator [candidate division Zixibacteria bacterium]|nr:response regulator [candidate division Zixibacteria bacterium]
MSESTATTTRTILVVDDEPTITGVLSTILTKGGYEVLIATEGSSAVTMAVEQSPDLILMDITMPGMNGYETAEKIKAIPELVSTPIIFLTGQAPGEDAGKAFASGGVSYLRKPFSTQQISNVVELALLSLGEQ